MSFRLHLKSAKEFVGVLVMLNRTVTLSSWRATPDGLSADVLSADHDSMYSIVLNRDGFISIKCAAPVRVDLDTALIADTFKRACEEDTLILERAGPLTLTLCGAGGSSSLRHLDRNAGKIDYSIAMDGVSARVDMVSRPFAAVIRRLKQLKIDVVTIRVSPGRMSIEDDGGLTCSVPGATVSFFGPTAHRYSVRLLERAVHATTLARWVTLYFGSNGLLKAQYQMEHGSITYYAAASGT